MLLAAHQEQNSYMERRQSGERRRDKRENTEGKDNAAVESRIPAVFLYICDEFV